MKIFLLVMSGVFLLLSLFVGGFIYCEYDSLSSSGPYILLSTLASLSAISFGWWISLYIAQRNSTISLISQSRLSDSYLKQIAAFQDDFPRGQILTYEKFNSKEYRDAQAGLINVLNFLEFISIGIKEGDLSESVCKAFFSKVFSNQWYRCSSVIHHLQVHEDTGIYCNFEYYAKKWNGVLKK